MLGLSYAAVPLYDLFCRVTGFGGTTQISNDKKTKKYSNGFSNNCLYDISFLFYTLQYRSIWQINMMQKKKLTPLILSGIFVLMLGLSYAAVPLYDLFCRVTGFGGTTQISNDAPKIVLNKVVSVRFDTNVNNLPWDFKARTNVIDVKVGQVNKIEFEVENYSNEPTAGGASFNVSPASFGKYCSKLGCFCFE